jgi:hypothetical protein
MSARLHFAQTRKSTASVPSASSRVLLLRVRPGGARKWRRGCVDVGGGRYLSPSARSLEALRRCRPGLGRRASAFRFGRRDCGRCSRHLISVAGLGRPRRGDDVIAASVGIRAPQCRSDRGAAGRLPEHRTADLSDPSRRSDPPIRFVPERDPLRRDEQRRVEGPPARTRSPNRSRCFRRPSDRLRTWRHW